MKRLHKILLVDDDETVNFINKLLLEQHHIAEQILIRDSGVEALHYIKQHCIAVPEDCVNLIVLDLNMPVMGGMDLLGELQQLGQNELIHTRIVVLTSSTHPRDLQQLRELGIRQVLEKPLDSNKIRQMVEFVQESGDFN